MTQNRDFQKFKAQTIEQILDKKNNNLTSAKDGLKIAEALNYGIKNVSKKIEDIVSIKSKDIFQLLVEGKITPDVYKIILDVDLLIESTLRTSNQEAEKILYTRQCEISFLQGDISQLKSDLELTHSTQDNLEKPIDLTSEEEKKTEYIRPDKNPNTRIGRASLDLAARKEAWSKKQKEEESSVIVSEELVTEEDTVENEKSDLKPKEKRGKKKLFNLF